VQKTVGHYTRAVLAGCRGELLAPTLLPYEMASVARTKMLRRPDEAQRILDCHEGWRRSA
jgi:hypothetical protein